MDTSEKRREEIRQEKGKRFLFYWGKGFHKQGTEIMTLKQVKNLFDPEDKFEANDFNEINSLNYGEIFRFDEPVSFGFVVRIDDKESD